MTLRELKEKVDSLYNDEDNRDSEVVIPIAPSRITRFARVTHINRGIDWCSGYILLTLEKEL